MRGLPSPFNGFRKFGARTVIDQIITATVAPAADAMFDGETVADIANFASLDSTGNYASSEGTIASVQWLVDGVDQAGTYELSAGEAIVLRVTDSAANTRDWTIDASVAAVVPAQFGTGDWSLANDGVDVTLTVTTLPDNGGSALTDLEYAVNGGSYTSLGAATTGDYTITAVATDTVTLRAVNAVGNGTASASKTVPAVAAGAPLSLDFTSGTYTDGTNTALADIITFTRTSTATYVDSSGVMQTATSGTVRDAHHEYDGTSWNRTLLLETDAATNVLDRSNAFDLYVHKGGVTETQDLTGPDGVSNSGWSVTGNSASDYQYLYKTATCPDDSNPAVASVFIAHQESFTGYPMFRLYFLGGTTVTTYCIFNPTTGTYNASDPVTVERWGPDWWRVSLRATNNSTGNTTARIYLFPAGSADGSTISNGATGTNGFFGAQVELNAEFPSSYIPTSGSTVTRAAETLQVNAASVPWSTTAMSWVWEGEMSSITGERSGFFAQRATGNDGMAFYVDTTDQAEAFNEVSTSTTLAAAGTVSRSYLTPIKAGLRMTTSEIQSVVDGVAGTNNTGNPGIYSSFSSYPLLIGREYSTYNFNGRKQRLRMWDSDIGASQLETETA